MARESPDGQAVIFIDEIDSLCSSRKEGEDESVRRVKTDFFVQMDGLDTKKGSKVLVLATTNLPWELDPAIIRRFEVKVYIPLPDTEARTKMFRILLGDTPHDLSDANFQKLGRETEGFSGSDINVLVKEAKSGPSHQCVDLAERQCMQEQHFKLVDGHYVPCEKCPHCSSNCRNCQICKARRMKIRNISVDKLRTRGVGMRDFVLKNSRVSVSEDQFKDYDKWTKEWGESGN
jgi:vacuolar protein-sorting-associated protein 4